MGDLIDTEKRIGGGENLYIRVNRSSGIISASLSFSSGPERTNHMLDRTAPHSITSMNKL